MNIILTGATSGIGFETLKQLVENGHTVFAIGRDFSKIDAYIEDNKNHIIKYVFDFKNIQDIEDLFSKFELAKDKLDGLIHCAGIEETLPLTLYTPDKIKQIYDINVFAGIELLRHFTKKKYSNEGSSVVFMSSVMGILGQPGKIGYCSSKAAVLGMVKASALEFSKRKIRVNAVLPGVVNTPMTQNLFAQLDEGNIKQITDMHPLGLGEVEDIVPMILFLISKDSKWITGQSFIIDGGYSVK
ncbi:SDR family NAD(P)-dependent oxidoreductase [Flavobacterium cellulosilyticum]|uniref:SDR family oxidoreductase n=1 Tax=Flavobacterium cellulosilyticum TaxID=2541731 RepID=A0A4V2YZT9_9FLAO|nr:SDR family oxidoreductase [Flavobacterium cellulosilyticum]TDD98387.1 SDR family oxidoreductase [Flavobacterium cellulosilyticum]